MGEKKEELIEIVGDENVLDDAEILDIYSSDYSFVPSRKPRFLVKAKDADEVQKIVGWANRTVTPLVPVALLSLVPPLSRERGQIVFSWVLVPRIC